MSNVHYLENKATPKVSDPYKKLKERVDLTITPDFTTLKAQGLTPVFVYGTLKRGKGNHHFLEDELYLGTAESVSKSFIMLGKSSFPYVAEVNPGSVQAGKIRGEVYAVDAFTMTKLDRLEGNGSFYTRQKKFFTLKDQEVKGRDERVLRPTLSCWVYMVPHKDYLHVSSSDYVLVNNTRVYYWG